MTRKRVDPQDRAIQVLVRLLQSHQGLIGVMRDTMTALAMPLDLRRAEEASDAAGKLLNDLRLGEVKMTAWEPTTVLWCVECGYNWEGDAVGYSDYCPECGGASSDA